MIKQFLVFLPFIIGEFFVITVFRAEKTRTAVQPAAEVCMALKAEGLLQKYDRVQRGHKYKIGLQSAASPISSYLFFSVSDCQHHFIAAHQIGPC